MRSRRGGFTLMELLVVVSIIALLISILLPSLGRAKEVANRAYCAANLSGIVKAMVVYDQDTEQGYPNVRPDATNPGFAYTNSFQTTPYGTNVYAAKNDAMTSMRGSPVASMFWLVLDGLRSPTKMFICKSDRWVSAPGEAARGGSYFQNFQDANQVSYSIAFPWATNGSRAPYWRNTLQSGIPIISDMAPFSGENNVDTTAPAGSNPMKYGSPNHEQKGMEVAFGDGHVEWTVHPYVAGKSGDNIWTVGTGGGTAITQSSIITGLSSTDDNIDIVMVPVRKTTNGTLGPP